MTLAVAGSEGAAATTALEKALKELAALAGENMSSKINVRFRMYWLFSVRSGEMPAPPRAVFKARLLHNHGCAITQNGGFGIVLLRAFRRRMADEDTGTTDAKYYSPSWL